MPKSKRQEGSTASPVSKITRDSRKREQNRLSQQCLREKRLLQSQQAAAMVESTKYSKDRLSDARQSSEITQLTDHLHRATQRNIELSEALLRMRKKLLSIGVSSNMAAG